MAATFGEQLRLAREARGISLREISEQTRISMRYLEAIEANDYKRLPGGIFNRSFIKAYAKYIGYDEKEALEAYARTVREQGETPDELPTTPHQSRVYTDGSSTRSPLVTLLLSVLILAVLSLGVYAALHWYRRREAAKSNVQPPPAATRTIQTASAPAPTPTPAGFDIQIKARGDRVWIKARPDKGEATEAILEPDETREFRPEQRLVIQLAKLKADTLEVTINGRQAKVPADLKGNLAEIVIEKDNYEQFLQ